MIHFCRHFSSLCCVVVCERLNVLVCPHSPLLTKYIIAILKRCADERRGSVKGKKNILHLGRSVKSPICHLQQ